MKEWTKKELRQAKKAMLEVFMEEYYHVHGMRVRICEQQVKMRNKVKLCHLFTILVILGMIVYGANEVGNYYGITGDGWLMILFILFTVGVLLWYGIYHLYTTLFISDAFMVRILQMNQVVK